MSTVSRMVRFHLRCLAVCAFATALVANPGPATAAVLQVNTTGDDTTPGDGLVTLREAIVAANGDSLTDLGESGSGADSIVFNLGLPATITVGALLPNIDSDMEIVGPGAGLLTISGGDASAILFVNSGHVAIRDIRLSDGRARGGNGGNPQSSGSGGGAAGMGGALFVNGGQVCVRNVSFEGNEAIGGNGGSGTSTGGFGGAGGGGVGQDGQSPNFVDTSSFGGPGGNGGPLGGVGGAAGTVGTGGFAGNGGAGAGGGGGGTGVATRGGTGGFGGGGGGTGVANGGTGASPAYTGGTGGFGGGGGGGGYNINSAGTDPNPGGPGGLAGTFGGNGANGIRTNTDVAGGGGGGGAGLGGAIFVRSGMLSIGGCSFTSNSAAGGFGGIGEPGNEPTRGQNGQGKGGAIFVLNTAQAFDAGVNSFTGNSAADDIASGSDNDNIFGSLAAIVDCNCNFVQDSVETANDPAADCDSNGIPDDCQPDCDGDGLPDACELDSDSDGVTDDCDDCPLDPFKTAPGVCGCNVADADGDSDGIIDCVDICPDGPNDQDCDSDGTPDACEPDCDNNGRPDDCEIDCDQNGTPDFCEGAGDCNTNGTPDTCEFDGDTDGVIDTCDGCPTDPGKYWPGVCGCGVPETDTDSDGVPDCIDVCPNTPPGVRVNEVGRPQGDVNGDCQFNRNDLSMAPRKGAPVDCAEGTVPAIGMSMCLLAGLGGYRRRRSR